MYEFSEVFAQGAVITIDGRPLPVLLVSVYHKLSCRILTDHLTFKFMV